MADGPRIYLLLFIVGLLAPPSIILKQVKYQLESRRRPYDSQHSICLDGI